MIEILRKKYPQKEKGNLHIYYIQSERRFHDFRVLIKNLEDRRKDFSSDENTLSKFISLVKPFRDQANSTAHSIIESPTEDDIHKFRICEMASLLDRVRKNI